MSCEQLPCVSRCNGGCYPDKFVIQHAGDDNWALIVDARKRLVIAEEHRAAAAQPGAAAAGFYIQTSYKK